MLQANSVALITEAMPRPLLGKGIGVQGAAQAVGLALGPAIGGVLLAVGGWRLIFLVNLPAGAVGLALGWFLLPRSRSKRAIERADGLGAGLLAVAAAGPLVYLSLANRLGYADPRLLAVLAAGVLAGVGFVRRERRIEAPLIDLSVFRRPALAHGLSAGLVSYLVLFGTLFVVPYYLLSAEHTSAALVGLQLSAMPIAIAIAAPIAGRLVNRVSNRLLTGGGLTLAAAGFILIALRHDTAGLIIGLALAGVGLGTFTPANNAGIMAASPSGHTGTVGGVLNMTRGLGTALGVALTTALYTSGAGTSAVTNGSRGLTLALVALALLTAATGLIQLAAKTPLGVTPDSPDRHPYRPQGSGATIALHGRRIQPRITTIDPVISRQVVSAKVADEVRSMMIGVVRSGTGTAAAIPGVEVAGKTGTAELRPNSTNPKDSDAWFVAFAPAQNPRIAVAVMLVGAGFGGTTAAPIARQVLQAALASNQN